MKLLFSMENLYPKVGGAEESMSSLINYLKEENEVAASYIGKDKKGIKTFNVENPIVKKLPLCGSLKRIIYNSFWSYKIKKDIDNFSPDILLTQLNLTPSSTLVAEENDVTSIVWIRSYSHFCVSGFLKGYEKREEHSCLKEAPLLRKLDIPFFNIHKNLEETALNKADLIICNSNFTSRVLKEWYGLDSRVVYPFVDVKKYKVDNEGNKILHVYGNEHKGIDITLEVARLLPEEDFIVVGRVQDKYRKEIKKRDNVEYLGKVDDMKKIYKKTKLVMMPSSWPEPYGRVPIEAAISGIPTLTSGKGGLKESMPIEEMSVESNNPLDYVEKIRSIDFQKYEDELIQHATKRSTKKQVSKFKKIVEEKLGVKI